MEPKCERWLAMAAAAVVEAAADLSRMPIAKLGNWAKGKVKFSITRADMDAVVANFRRMALGEVAVDYDHSSFYSAGKGQPVPAAGWVKAIDDAPDADGVLWGSVEWTPRAKELIANKEYKYISPTLAWGVRDHRGNVLPGAALISAALTNSPVLDEMPAITLSEHGWTEIEPGDGRDGRSKKTVAIKSVLVLDDKKVKVVLDDGTEAVSTEAIPSPKVIQLSDLKRDSNGKFDFTSLPQDGLIAGEVMRAVQAQAALDAAIEAGKITPAQRKHFEALALSDLTGFVELMSSMKPQVDLKEHGIGGSEGLKPGDRLAASLRKRVGERMAADKGLTAAAATKLVLSEDPELRRQYLGEMASSRSKKEGGEE